MSLIFKTFKARTESKHRPPTWQQALLSLIFGVVVGFPSCAGLGHAMFHSTPFWGLYLLGSLAGAVAFISGLGKFLAITAKAAISPVGSAAAVPNLAPARPFSKKSPVVTWQHSLALIIFGGVFGYWCFENMDIWGSGKVSPLRTFYPVGFLAAGTAFISGWISLLAIAIETVTSSVGIAANTGRPRLAVSGPPSFVKSPSMSRNSAENLIRLRIALFSAIALATLIVFREWGQPTLTTSYGRYYWLNRFLTLLVSEIPFAIALVRIWKGVDLIGFILTIVAGSAQIIFVLIPNLGYNGTRLAAWPWLTALVGLALIVFAWLAWRPLFSLKEGAGLLISIFFGFVAYTWLAQIALAILRNREQRWMYQP